MTINLPVPDGAGAKTDNANDALVTLRGLLSTGNIVEAADVAHELDYDPVIDAYMAAHVGAGWRSEAQTTLIDMMNENTGRLDSGVI